MKPACRFFSRFSIFLLILSASTHLLGGQSGWFPFTVPWDDDVKTVTDASDLLVDYPGQDPSTVIDARGFVRAGSDGHFYFEKTGKRARYWGVYFTFSANFPPRPDESSILDPHLAEKLARHLAKLGINVVRLHHMDYYASPSGIWDRRYFPNDSQHLDPNQLQRLDYLLYQLRRNGIYVNINLKVARHFGPGDGLPDTNRFTNFFNGVCHYNPRMIELQRDYARQLLAHVNPYSGKSYANDPGVLCVEIANEDSLFGTMLNDGGLNYLPDVAGSLPQSYSDELDDLWNNWLRQRYGDQEGLVAAWSVGGQAIDPSEKMRNGDFNNGTAEWFLNVIDQAKASWTTAPVTGPDGLQGPSCRIQVTSDGTNWHVQLLQDGHAIEKGKLYEIVFYARAASPVDIGLDVMRGAPDWRNYGLSKTFHLSTSWQRCAATFYANETDLVSARPTFELGAGTTTIWIDKVAFRETAPQALDDREDLEAGTIRRLVRSELGGYAEPRVLDQFRFYSQLDESYFTGMRRFLKEDLGVKALVTGTAPWWTYLGDTAIQSKLDFVDGHYYWDHPSWPGVADWSPKGWVIKNLPWINQLDDLCSLASQAVNGKPFTVSEFNYVFPNSYACEGPPLIALIANLQDWDAVYMFDYAGDASGFDDLYTASFFDLAGNPIKSAQMPIVSRIFLKGQSAVAKESVGVNLSRDELALGYAQNKVGAADFLATKGLDRRTFLQSRLRIRTFDLPAPAPAAHSVPDGSLAASNGELFWNRSNAEASFMKVEGTGVEGAAGFLPHEPFDFGDWSFQVRNGSPDHLVVLLQARDSTAIRESRRLIFSVWTEHANSGMVWNSTHTSVDNHWGGVPTVVKPAKIDLTLNFGNENGLRLYPLDATGARKPELTGQSAADGVHYSVDTGRDQTVWYEIDAGEAVPTLDYSISPDQLQEFYSDGAPAAGSAGWLSIEEATETAARILPLLEFQSQGVLTSLVELPLTDPAATWWLPVLHDRLTDTAIAFLNTQAAPLTVTLQLHDGSGAFGSAQEMTLQPGETSAFYAPGKWDLPDSFEGSLQLTANLPFVALAMRSTANSRGDILLTPYSSPHQWAGPAYFPQLVAGGGYSSEVLILNPSTEPLTARLEFFTPDGSPTSTGDMPESSDLSLEPGQFRRLQLLNQGASFVGYLRVTPLSGAVTPLVSAVVTRWQGAAPVSEVSIPASMPVTEEDFLLLERPWQHSAVALLNPGDSPLTADIEILPSDDLPTGLSTQIEIPAGASGSFFLNERVADLPTHGSSIVRIHLSAEGAILPILGAYNSRNDFLMSALRGGELSTPPAIIPRFATGAGYRTMLYLFPAGNTAAQGTIRVWDEKGDPLSLDWRP